MCDTGYCLRELVGDLKALRLRGLPEAQLLDEIRSRVKRLQLMKHAWLRPSMCVPGPEPGMAGIFKLHEEPDHSLAIFVVTWLPGEETPPHDHQTWAVIAGLEGRETQHWWRRLDDGSVEGYAEVERHFSERVDEAAIIAMPSDAIHSLHNDSGTVSVTLHVYGINVDYTDRHRFDPRRRTASPYKLGGTSTAERAA